MVLCLPRRRGLSHWRGDVGVNHCCVRERLPLGLCCLRGPNGAATASGGSARQGGLGHRSSPSGAAWWGWSHRSTAVGVNHCSVRERSPLGRGCPRGPNVAAHRVGRERAPGGSSCLSCPGGSAWRGLSHRSGAVGVEHRLLRERSPRGRDGPRGPNGAACRVGRARASGGPGCQTRSSPSGVAWWGASHRSGAVGVDHCSVREQSPGGRGCPRGPNAAHSVGQGRVPGGAGCQSGPLSVTWRGMSHQSRAVGGNHRCVRGTIAAGAWWPQGP